MKTMCNKMEIKCTPSKFDFAMNLVTEFNVLIRKKIKKAETVC